MVTAIQASWLDRDTSAYGTFVAEAGGVRDELEAGQSAWGDSPFAWLWRMKNIPKAKAVREIVVRWLAQNGLRALNSTGAQSVIYVENHPVCLRMSMQWQDGGYAFQQIRVGDYEWVLLVGISPSEAHCWFVPLDVLRANAQNQHGSPVEKWVRFDPRAVPDWLLQYGGDLDAGINAIAALLGAWGYCDG